MKTIRIVQFFSALGLIYTTGVSLYAIFTTPYLGLWLPYLLQLWVGVPFLAGVLLLKKGKNSTTIESREVIAKRFGSGLLISYGFYALIDIANRESPDRVVTSQILLLICPFVVFLIYFLSGLGLKLSKANVNHK